MPTPSTVAELLELVTKSELIPQVRLTEFLEKVAQTTPPEVHAGRSSGEKAAPNLPQCSPREFADMLVAAGLATPFQIEQLLQGKWRGFTIGKYRVLDRLGSGGMGSVYLCEHVMMGRRVAVKVLPTSQANNPAALGRFFREARASGALDHPNLVTAHDIDQDGTLHFLVMEYIDGTNLQELVARVGPLAPERAAHYISMAAQGLDAAHRAGLVHRDVKPANLIVERNGNVRVLDLGLARFFNDHNDQLTIKYDERNVLGTADYVAPEQAVNSHTVDIRADIYSLGGTLYFLLTGRPPFAGGKVAQKLIWHQERNPQAIAELRPEVPRNLINIVSRMMAKKVKLRYQTPAEVVEALRPWTSRPIPAPSPEELPTLLPSGVPSAPVKSPSSSRAAPANPPARTPGSSRSRPRTPLAPNAPIPAQETPRASYTGLPTPRLMAAHTSTAETPRPRPAILPHRPKKVSPPPLPSRPIETSSSMNRWLTRTLYLVMIVVAGAAVGLSLGWVIRRF
jgi:eukaryotic-like serine/threonine-protein kinase